MKLDLHMHSDVSLDGEFSPGALARMCAESGIGYAALTDHNSVRGVKEFMSACDEPDGRAGIPKVRTLPGIELDCICGGRDDCGGSAGR